MANVTNSNGRKSNGLRALGLLAAVGVAVVGGTRLISQTPAPPQRSVAAAAPADLVLRGGRIVTLDDRMPEARALAARDGRIIAVGTEQDVAAYVGPSTKVIDLAGKFAMPGFIEGHGHFAGIGEGKINLELMNTKSWDEILHMVAEAAERAKPGEWIVGRGWHQEKWSSVPDPNVEGFPTHASLDKVAPNNPVVLTHASGHASFVNQKAMDASNITASTPNPNGGEILKDAAGQPTGLLRESASSLVQRPPLTISEQRRSLALADQEAIAKGITSFQDAGSSFATIDLVKQVIDEKLMHVRLWMMVRMGNDALRQNLARYKTIGYGNQMLTVRAVKVVADGALGSRGAWLLQPYADLPATAAPGGAGAAGTSRVGLPSASVATLPETAEICLANGVQLCVHAIGDRANREVLDVYEAAFAKSGRNGKDLRWRIEHAQHLSAADIPRFGQLGVIASMQAIHCTSDAPYVLQRLGTARAEEGAYVWQKLMKSGALVTNGTDAPVEDVDPIANYYAAVTRKLKDGSVFYGDQKMTRMEALRSYTINNAIAAFEEDLKGSLSVGKLADITVLTADITTVPDDQIRSAKVAYTIVGGVVVFPS